MSTLPRAQHHPSMTFTDRLCSVSEPLPDNSISASLRSAIFYRCAFELTNLYRFMIVIVARAVPCVCGQGVLPAAGGRALPRSSCGGEDLLTLIAISGQAGLFEYQGSVAVVRCPQLRVVQQCVQDQLL